MATKDDKIIANFLRELDSIGAFFHSLKNVYQKGDDAFAAVLKAPPSKDSKTIEWRSGLHPPHVAQIIEIMSANLIDEDIEADLVPFNPMWEEGAKAHECLMKEQLEIDRFREKIVQYWLQLLVRGVTAAKACWVQEYEEQYFEIEGKEELEKRWSVVKDQPSFVVCDMNGLWWDHAAASFDDIRFIHYQTYETLEVLKQLAEVGPNGEEPLYKNIDKIKMGDNTNFKESHPGSPPREMKNRVEIIERWSNDRLLVIANRTVVIRDEPNPFLHGKIPFVIATGSPKLFRIEGRSVADFIGDLQSMLWEFQNQKVDNARLMNNAVVLIRDSMEDSKRFQVYPGARWPVMHPQDVKFWEPNSQILQNGTEIEANIKEDILNLSGAVAYLSGASTESIDNKTATGIQIVNNGAQKRILRLKQQGLFGLERYFNLHIKCNQQLLSEPKMLRIQQKYGGHDWIKVDPATLAGTYEYRIRSTTESLNRAEKRAEISTMLQVVMSNAPILAQLDPTIKFEYLELWNLFFERYGLESSRFVKRQQMDPMQQLMQLMPNQQQSNNVVPITQASGY